MPSLNFAGRSGNPVQEARTEGLLHSSGRARSKWAANKKKITRGSQFGNTSFFESREEVDRLLLDHQHLLRFMIYKARTPSARARSRLARAPGSRAPPAS